MTHETIPAAIGRLTDRQKQILRHVLAHRQAKEIARLLNISLPTVKEHLAIAREHLGVSTSREAALMFSRYEVQNNTLPEEGYPSGRVTNAPQLGRTSFHETSVSTPQKLTPHIAFGTTNSDGRAYHRNAHLLPGDNPKMASLLRMLLSSTFGQLLRGLATCAHCRKSQTGWIAWFDRRLKTLSLVQLLGVILIIALAFLAATVMLLSGTIATIGFVQELSGLPR